MPLNLTPLREMKGKILTAVAEEAAASILAPAQERIPRDTDTAHDSGRVIKDGSTVYVSFGRSDDRNPKTGEPSNSYIETLEEDSEAVHPNGQAHFLRTITDAETGALIPGVVSVTWKATAGQLPVATLEMQCAVMDVVAEMEEAKDDPPH
jgi:hypothetical protein